MDTPVVNVAETMGEESKMMEAKLVELVVWMLGGQTWLVMWRVRCGCDNIDRQGCR